MRAFVTAALLIVATLPLSAEPLPQIDLRGGTQTTLPDTAVTLRLIEITDQRCPAGVDCVWEGLIRARLTLALPDAAPVEVILCNQCEDGQRSVIVAGLELTLVGLAPSQEELDRMARHPILSDYTLTVTYGPADH